jgi:hypothetical protein
MNDDKDNKMPSKKGKIWKWSTKQEIDYLRTLNKEKVLKYCDTMSLRVDWDGLNKKEIQKAIKEILKKS